MGHTEAGQTDAGQTGADQTGADRPNDGRVDLTIPADPAMVAVLRTVTATLAARRDFTIEEIDDLRIAVDEACALLLPHGGDKPRLSASFFGSDEAITIEVRIKPIADPGESEAQGIDQSGFAWLVLSALADDVTSTIVADELRVRLTKARAARG